MNIDFTNSKAENAVITSSGEDFCEVTLGKMGGGITLAQAKGTNKRYITGFIEVLEDHSAAMTLRCYIKGAEKDRIRILFGLLSRFKTKVCFDLNWLDNGSIYTNRTYHPLLGAFDPGIHQGACPRLPRGGQPAPEPWTSLVEGEQSGHDGRLGVL
jgi:hypothetical protein